MSNDHIHPQEEKDFQSGEHSVQSEPEQPPTSPDEEQELADSMVRHPAQGERQPLSAVENNETTSILQSERTMADIAPKIIFWGNQLDELHGRREKEKLARKGFARGVIENLINRFSPHEVSRAQDESEMKIGEHVLPTAPLGQKYIFYHNGHNKWVWETHYRDKRSRVVIYDVRQGTVLRSQDGSEPIVVELSEAENLHSAAQSYAKKVAEQLYGRKL